MTRSERLSRANTRIKINAVKIVVGTIMVAGFPFQQLQVKAQAAAPTVTQTSLQTTYHVQSGDTLYKVATRFDTTVEKIKTLNQLKTDNLYVGQVLTVPASTYIVSSGDTLFSIAKKTNTTLDKIKLLNNLKSDAIYVGQKLYIPSAQPVSIIPPVPNVPTPPTVTPTPPTTEPSNQTTYTVVAGDTLYIVANKFNTTIAAIKESNKLTSDMIYLGQVLVIPSTPPIKVPEPVKQTMIHTVVAGETLYIIANKYNTTVAAIRDSNKLSTDMIFIGQQLTIPMAQSEPTPQPPKETPTTQESSYVVVAGDTLTLIAKKFNTAVAAIKDRNKLTTDMIFVGQTLLIPTNTVAVPPTPPADTIAPVLEGISASDKIAGSTVGSYSISGKSEIGSSVSILISDKNNQQIQKTVTIGPAGTFSETFDLTALKDGEVKITIVSSDQAGNKSNAFIKNVVKKTKAPLIPAALLEGVINTDNVSAFAIKGNAESGSNVTLTLSDEAGKEVRTDIIVDDSGMFEIALNASELQDGALILTGFSTDSFGNQSATFTENIIKDTMGPTELTVAQLSPISIENQKAFIINGATDAANAVNIVLSDGTSSIVETVRTDESGNFSKEVDVSLLKDGNLTLQVYSSDANGNKGTSVENIIIKDTAAPTGLTLLGTNTIITKNNVKEFHVQGTSEEDGAIVEITATDGQKVVEKTALVVGNGFDIPMDLRELSDGEITFTVRQKDIFGNQSESISQTHLKDTISLEPVVNISSVRNNNGGFIYQLQGNAEANSEIIISIVGKAGSDVTTQQMTTDHDGNFTFSMNFSSFIDTQPFITIRQVDIAGNESSDKMSPIGSYIVGSGDNLWKVATRFGTSTTALMELNELDSTMIQIGQELKLPMVAGLESEVVSETEAFNMGYLYFGSSSDFVNTMNQTAGTINVVSPTYFDLNSDGSLKLTNQTDRYFIASMQKSDVRVVPFLSNHWDREVGNAALENREQLSQQIADSVVLYNLDGINVDIENITHENRDEFTDFVRLLREKIPEGKEVSVAVPANPTGSNVGWHGAYDYGQLAQYSDYLMIMAYDESYAGGPAGPIASIGFAEQSIQYALDKGVTKEKIVLGIGHYGRYWKEGAQSGGQGISNQQIRELVETYNGTITFDEESKSPKATFTIHEGDPKPTVYGAALTAGDYVVWFENEQSIRAKYDLIEKYGIKGTGNWGVDQENTDFWKTFSSWIAPPEEGAVEGDKS